MTVRQRIGHLVNVLCRLCLVESSVGLLLQTFVKLPLRSKLQDQVNSALVIKVPEKPEDVCVPQVGLNLDFPPEHKSL